MNNSWAADKKMLKAAIARATVAEHKVMRLELALRRMKDALGPENYASYAELRIAAILDEALDEL